ncbi:hypothetical protein MASR1M42_03640 [Azonexus hydrophilus]
MPSATITEKIGVRLNAFCLPQDRELSRRLVRAVVIHVERVPPETTVSNLVAGALAKAFPCPEPAPEKAASKESEKPPAKLERTR